MSERRSKAATVTLEQEYRATLETFLQAQMRYHAAIGMLGNEWAFPWIVEVSRSIQRIPNTPGLPWGHPARQELGDACDAAYDAHIAVWQQLQKEQNHE